MAVSPISSSTQTAQAAQTNSTATKKATAQEAAAQVAKTDKVTISKKAVQIAAQQYNHRKKQKRLLLKKQLRQPKARNN